MAFNLPSMRSVLWPNRNTKSNIDNVFDDLFSNLEYRLSRPFLLKIAQDLYPQLDISVTNSHYCLELDIPGVDKKDINIKVDNGIITIKGKKELEEEHKGTNFYIRERFHGDFQRSLSLPSGVNTDAIEADFKNGVLKIRIPKTETASTKVIDIKN